MTQEPIQPTPSLRDDSSRYHVRAHQEGGRDAIKQRLLNKGVTDAEEADPVRGDLIVALLDSLTGLVVKWRRFAKGTAGMFLKQGANDPAWTFVQSTDVQDFREAVEDDVAALLQDSNDIDFTYTDNGAAAGVLTAGVKVQGLSNPYKFRAHRGAATQALVTGGFRVIQFDQEDFDTNGNYDNATNFNYTAPFNGFYHFDASVDMGPNADAVGTTYTLTLYVNGAARRQGNDLTIEVAAAGATAIGLTVAGLEQLSAGDTVDIRLNHNAGANRNANPNAVTVTCVFSGFMVCAT